MRKILRKIWNYLWVPPKDSPFLKKNQNKKPPSTIGGIKTDDLAKYILIRQEIDRQKNKAEFLIYRLCFLLEG